MTDFSEFLIIGDSPGPSAEIKKYSPLLWVPNNCSGAKLMKYMGLARRDYARIAKINLCPAPEKHLPREYLTLIMAWNAQTLYRGGALREKSVFLLGRRVMVAFTMAMNGAPPMDRFKWYGPFLSSRSPWRRVSYLPHPSGMNHYWNSEENKETAAEFFKETFDET